MTKYDSNALKEFVSISGAPDSIARTYLNQSNGSLNSALELFYADGHGLSAAPKRQKKTVDKDFKTMFRKYVSENESEMGIEGIERLAEDMSRDPLDVAWLIFAFRCEAKTMGVFTEEEFIRGVSSLSSPDPKKLACALDEVKFGLTSNRSEFEKLYNFAFKFSLDPGSRNISMEVATTLWNLLLPFSGWGFYEHWLDYIQSESVSQNVKAITKDSWSLLMAFAKRVVDERSLKSFDRDEGAWPILIDEFYDYLVSNFDR